MCAHSVVRAVRVRGRAQRAEASSISLLSRKNLDFGHLRHFVPLGAFQRQLRPRRVDGGTQQVARCAPVHSAGSQLPLRVLGRYRIVAAEGDSTPLRSEIKL